jgi:hypothetical protein
MQAKTQLKANSDILDPAAPPFWTEIVKHTVQWLSFSPIVNQQIPRAVTLKDSVCVDKVAIWAADPGFLARMHTSHSLVVTQPCLAKVLALR